MLTLPKKVAWTAVVVLTGVLGLTATCNGDIGIDPDPAASASATASVSPGATTVAPSPSVSVVPTSPPATSPPATSPPPIDPAAAWPAAHNTGYPHGLPGDTRTPVTLTAYTGPYIITTPGTVIDGRELNDQLEIRATGVVIKNSLVRVPGYQAIKINDAYHATIMDSELDGQGLDGSAGGVSLIGDGSYTLIRVNAHHSGDIARANWAGVAIVDSWLHDPTGTNPDQHNDVIQTTDGTCDLATEGIGAIAGTTDTYAGTYCIRIVHSRLENAKTQTSCILMKADQGNIRDVLIANNLLNGGGYSLYWYDHNTGVYHSTAGKVLDNRWQRSPSGGYWPNGGSFNTHAIEAAELPEWTGNAWLDDGTSIAR